MNGHLVKSNSTRFYPLHWLCEWLTLRRGCSTSSGKEPGYLQNRLDGPQNWSERIRGGENLFSLPGFKSRTVQLERLRYTGCTSLTVNTLFSFTVTTYYCCSGILSPCIVSVPCRRFAAFKRSLELRGSRILDEICRNISRPRVPPSVARGLSRRWT